MSYAPSTDVIKGWLAYTHQPCGDAGLCGLGWQGKGKLEPLVEGALHHPAWLQSSTQGEGLKS